MSNIIIGIWSGLLETNKIDKDEILINQVIEYLRFLQDRRDDLYGLLDSNDYSKDLFLYSRKLLFMYCSMQNKPSILSFSKSNGYDEIMEMLRDARFCLKQAEREGLQKGLVYFYLASISYELQDDSPEIIYEYCRNALDKGFNYPELQDILCSICKVLVSYPGQYCNDAKMYLSKAKRRENRQITNPPFCPNSYIK